MKKIVFGFFAALLLASCGTMKKSVSLQPVYDFPKVDQGGRVAIVAHRGFWKCEESGNSQNSLAALGNAQKNRFWGSECDIHVTQDGRMIVNHDPAIDGLKINEHIFMSLSRHLLPNGEPRPAFEEYVSLARKGARRTMLVVEIKKQQSEALENKLVDRAIACLKDNRMYKPDCVVFISFSMNVCRRIARVAPEFVNQYLSGDVAPSKLAAEGINGIDYNYKVFVRHPEWVKEAHDLGMSVNVWTVNKPEQMRKAVAWGVDAITTNEPLMLREILGEKEYGK